MVKALLPVCLVCGCASFSPVTIARQLGTAGWFQADGQSKWQPVEKGAGCGALPTNVGD